MALKTNLVSYWSLDESSTGVSAVTRNDSHGTNHLTDNNTTASGTGKISDGADFETTNSEYLSLTDTSDLSVTGDFSWCAWVKLETLAANQTMLGKWNATGNQRSYAFFINTSGALRVYISSDGSNANTSKLTFSHTALSTATWYHLAFAYTASAGTIDFWINGSAQTQLTGNRTSVYDSTADFGLGNSFGDFGYFDGIIDEVAFWGGRVITGSDVSEIYNGGSGLAYSSWDTGGGGSPTPTLMMLGVGT